MFDTRKNLHNRGIMDVIKILSTNGESGRLEVMAGKTDGAFFFKNGQLVDARVGHLTGFQAINAAASIRDAQFNFDPSAVPPDVTSITPNERVVLKQFFGIDTIDPNAIEETPVYPDDIHETPVYPADEEVTLETSRIPLEALQPPVAAVAEVSPSRSLYRGALVFVVLFILIAAAAVALRNQYRERVLSASAATTEQPSSPPVAEEVKTNNPPASVAKTEQPSSPPVAEEVRTNNPPASVAKTEQPSSPPLGEKVNPNNSPASVAVGQPTDNPSLAGKWNVVNTIQKTSYRSFQNMKIGFDLSIDQDGKSFTGRGQKVSENGHSLPANNRTPIEVKGSINGDRVEATFFEAGAMRKTSGRIVWRIDKAGALNGTFVSTAAGASGKSAAKKAL